jgi:hypothetical protein
MISRVVAAAGRHIGHVVVCASSRAGKDAVRARLRPHRWSEYVPGDWIALHLRDGCGFLPFAGRALKGETVDAADGNRLDVRISVAGIPGHPWQVVCMDAGVRQAAQMGRRTVAAALTSQLGRPAQFADLRMLGPTVSAVVEPGERITGLTML